MILDWDGTLLDNLALLYLCVSRVFRRYGLESPTLQEYRQEIDVDFMKFFHARGIPQHITAEEIQKILKETKFEYYEQENRSQVKLREDAIAVLSGCRKLDIKTAIISAETPEVLERGLARFGVRPWLNYHRGLAYRKGAALLETCTLFNVAPAQTFYVDDLAQGIKEAKEVGITVFGMLNNGHNAPERILAAKPDFAVNSLTEVLEIIKNIPN